MIQKLDLFINTSLRTIPKEFSEQIRINGHITREDLFQVYRKSSIAVFPSFVESFSMAPLESMICGCPTIYTKLGSGPEVITDGFDGILVDPFNVQEICDAMYTLINDSVQLVKISNNCQLTIRKRFSQEIMMEKSLEFYRAITRSPLA